MWLMSDASQCIASIAAWKSTAVRHKAEMEALGTIGIVRRRSRSGGRSGIFRFEIQDLYTQSKASWCRFCGGVSAFVVVVGGFAAVVVPMDTSRSHSLTHPTLAFTVHMLCWTSSVTPGLVSLYALCWQTSHPAGHVCSRLSSFCYIRKVVTVWVYR